MAGKFGSDQQQFIKIFGSPDEMERTMNTLGARKDELNEKVDMTNELVLEEQREKENEKRKKRMEMKFAQFDPSLATLDLDPPNIFTPPSKRKKPSN